MWKENKRQLGSTGESPSYNKIIATLWETNNTLLLSRTVSVTSWQVHLKLIMLHFVEFCPAPGAGSCKHKLQSVSPWQPVLTFQRFRVGLNRSAAFPWAITATKMPLPRDWDFPTSHAWRGGCWSCGTCLSSMPRKGNMTPANRKAVHYSFNLRSAVATAFLPAAFYCSLMLESFCSDNTFSFAERCWFNLHIFTVA